MNWKLKHRQQLWLAAERGTIRKDWGGKIRVALGFPNRYAVGMSNLGFQSVYQALNRLETLVCERFFYPEPEDFPEHRRAPGNLLSVESQRPLRDFDLIAFSLAFENDYPNLLEMLALAGLPLRSARRSEALPLVVAGGIAVCLNPEPLALFVDLFFAGEAESLLASFWERWLELQSHDLSRQDRLLALARDVPGIYVPSLYQDRYQEDGTLLAMEPNFGAPPRVMVQRADLSSAPVCQTSVFTPHTEFSNVALLELGRGCGRGCRFCAAGFVCRPPRYQSADKLRQAADELLPATDRLGLVSAAVSDHPEVIPVCQELLARGAALSFSSLRADTLTPELLASLTRSRHQAVAIAPDAGSERLRRAINKGLSTEQILNAAEILVEAGVMQLKLYFMIGLPTETLDDLQALADLTKKIKHHVLHKSRGRKKMGTITLSINAFVPKPFTPFQWAPFAGIKTIKERTRWIRQALQKVPNVRVHFDLPKWAFIEALLTKGDRRVGQFLERLVTEGASWPQVLKNVPFNPDFWVMRERGRDEVFPWEILDHGIDRSFLWDEYQRALKGLASPPCQPELCRRCGVCR
ncbi:MAG TPA: radical SAM protein [Syntrophobacteraceae bacterium]|nr:radical SAM protein [Syntrophobacteraceae bacterium]